MEEHNEKPAEPENKEVKPEHSHEHHEHHVEHHNPSKKNKILLILVIILGIVGVINILFTFGLFSNVKDKIAEAEETSRPADIQLITLADAACDNCYNIVPVVENVKKTNVKVSEENTIDFSSEEGKELVGKYSITKIPTVIVTGEVNKTKLSGFIENNDALVFSGTLPPYTDASSGKVKGLVTSTILTHPKCDDCVDLAPIVQQLKQSQIVIVDEQTIDATSSEGKVLTEAYAITKFPTLILSKEASEYPAIAQIWQQIGTVENDGSFVMRQIQPLYYDAAEKRVVGYVDVTYLTDDSCTSCYNVSRHRPIIANLGIDPRNEKYVDISSAEGKRMVEKYNITLVPTIILSKDADFYQSLKSVWRQVGKIDEDGSYVFTNIAVMRGIYKDLSTGQEINPVPQQQAEQ